jgi:hypothetical protein
MLVELPAQIGEAMGLDRFKAEAMWFDRCVQSGFGPPDGNVKWREG